MAFTKRWNRLKTHFSEGMSVVKRHISVVTESSYGTRWLIGASQRADSVRVRVWHFLSCWCLTAKGSFLRNLKLEIHPFSAHLPLLVQNHLMPWGRWGYLINKITIYIYITFFKPLWYFRNPNLAFWLLLWNKLQVYCRFCLKPLLFSLSNYTSACSQTSLSVDRVTSSEINCVVSHTTKCKGTPFSLPALCNYSVTSDGAICS
jgi:hypothetical protein